ncbi:RhoGAP-domain-containing protein [Anaeromyces robustus]|uniref:RhoGAP-domain-containing protein n=1 Tax=Anaeromyces robustus TaxID=1754192 RepID=A0A1Y1WUC2_9FUNG|nr:RhoGAP-domain-containing protein [Anaeromyces robustus]|eukprot:ORX76826.1 RhoGAP-domain-containing protein [Anaeromyces robustus]
MAEGNETIESLTQKLKDYEKKNKELTEKVNELNTFIQKQNLYIKKLKEELNEKEVVIVQQKSSIEHIESCCGSPVREKPPKTPLSIKTSFPSQSKISYKYSKFSSPTTDGSFASFSAFAPPHIEHMKHSSTEDNIANKDFKQGRKLSQTSQIIKENKFSASESNIVITVNSIDSLNRTNKITTSEDNESNVNSSINDFEDKEILADDITVYILKLVFTKNDKNKKDISFIISIRNADSGDELWKIEKSYTDIVNLENNIKLNYPKNMVQNIGKLPERNLNSLKMESKQIQLKITMEIYLQHLCNIFRNSIEIAEFLSKDIMISNNKEATETDIKSGYLFKKNFMGWRTKYFVLNDKSLSYYETKGGDLGGNIHLKSAKVMPFNPSGLNREKFHHAFKIIEYRYDKNSPLKEERIYAKHLLCSENDNDRDEWVEKIKSVIENLKNSDPEYPGSPFISTSHLDIMTSNNSMLNVVDPDNLSINSNFKNSSDIIDENNNKNKKENVSNNNTDNKKNNNENNDKNENEIKKEDKVNNDKNENEIEKENKENNDKNENEIEKENKEDNDKNENEIKKEDHEDNEESLAVSKEVIIDATLKAFKPDISSSNVSSSVRSVRSNDENSNNDDNVNNDEVENNNNDNDVNNDEVKNNNNDNDVNNDEVENNNNDNDVNNDEVENNNNDSTVEGNNNNGWNSSDSEDEDVNVITDYDENNYLPKGFNFEDFEKQGIDINEYIKKNNLSQSQNIENKIYEEPEEENINENDEKNTNVVDDNFNNTKTTTETKASSEVHSPTENNTSKKDVVIDDNERVMQQMIPPPLVPKSKISNPKQKLMKEEKNRRLHFSWYKFKKSSSSDDSKDIIGNKKKVFGVPLETAVKNSKIKEDYELPAIVYRCIEYLDAKGAYEEEGIYRLSGSKATIQSLKNRFDRFGDVNLLQDKEIYDVHVIAGLLKLYLRELPTTIMTKEFQPRFVEIASIPNREEKIRGLANLISYLPLANYTLLRCLAAHLVRIVQNSDLNKMTLSNIAIVFGPTLGIPIGLFVLILSEFEAVFCWTTLKESEEEENIMSILFSGPEDYLNVSSVSKAQRETRNRIIASSTNNINTSQPILCNEPKFKSSGNINNEKSKKDDKDDSDDSDSDVHINSNELITGSIKLRNRSNNNVQKGSGKIGNDSIDVIKEEETNNIRESLSLGTEIENLINEKCKNLDDDVNNEHLESILNSKDKEIANDIRRRQERCSSLFISSASQIEYVKSLRRLSVGESQTPVKHNRNSEDYMVGVPDNFRLSEMFAKEIKIKENDELIDAKDICYENGLSQ